MQTTITYKGKLNGVSGLWCGFCPEGVEVEEEITVYKPEDGKVFMKDGEYFDCVIQKDGVNIENYEEVIEPEESEE